jgi:hypothetical protein
MVVDSPYVGDWMASAYTVSGKRYDFRLFLNPDGTYERLVRSGPDHERLDRGRWHHQEGDETLRLESESPDEEDRISNQWWVLSVKTCEDSNCLMVLRWMALASRNLPILFYRVHLPGRCSSEQLGIGVLEKELATYKRELPKLLTNIGKFALIHGDEVSGVWETYLDALQEGCRLFGLEPFLIKEIQVVDSTHHVT